MFKKVQFYSLLLIAVVALAPISYATTLSPGGSLTPPYTAFVPGDFGVVVADTGVVSFTGTTAPPLSETRFTGKLREEVVVDNSTGFLDFIYQILSTGGPDNIGKFTTINYQNVSINAGTCPTCTDLIGGAPDIDPLSIGRSGGVGSTIAFDYGDPNGILAPGDETSVLVLKTNSSMFAIGSTSVIDGGTANVATFDPTPEPMYAGLLLGGLFGAGLLVARKFQVKQN